MMDEYLNEWGLPELMVSRALGRCWSGTLDKYEREVLGRFVLYTLSEGRYSVTISLAAFFKGLDEKGMPFAGPAWVGPSKARKAVAMLECLGLIAAERAGGKTRFTINPDAIIDGGKRIIAQRHGAEAAERVLL